MVVHSSKSKSFVPWLIGIVTIGGVIFVILSLIRMVGPPPSQSGDELLSLTVPVTKENLAVEIEASGTIEPIQSVNISPKRPGILVKLLVEQGMKVKKGQILAVMENQEVQAEVNKADAQLQEASANLEEIQARLPEEITQAKNRWQQSLASLKEVESALQFTKETLPREIEQAQADVTATNSSFELAVSRLNRNKDLLTEGAITQDYYDQLMKDYLSTKANLQEAKKRLEKLENTQIHQINQKQEIVLQWQAKVSEDRTALTQKQKTKAAQIAQLKAAVATAKAESQRLKIQYQDTIIKAPFDGIVTQKYATEGAFVTPQTSASNSLSATSASILALAKGLEVLVKVPEVDLVLLQLDQPVNIIADAFPNEIFKGKVKRIAPEAVVQQNVTSFEVALELLNGQNKLLSKMNVDVTFIAKKIENALVIPTVSVVKKDGKTGVMFLNIQTNKPEFKPVNIGLVVDDKTQILSGLKTDERVFIKSVETEQKMPFFK
jgi:HlyD family secretion protein